ncbi:helix-turn-helix domain-containing protein [Limibacter armeniacum]|uniref:helix-turn-helix domain-containing protein n=1 Tax=Limibacter armeniacum TaxID=466084 RepID=UPI002FE653CC
MAHLKYSQRQKIEALLAEGISQSEIARQLCVSRATISREITRNQSEDGNYVAKKAEHKKELRRYIANQQQRDTIKGIHLKHKYPKLVKQKKVRQYHNPFLIFLAATKLKQRLCLARFRVELRVLRTDTRGYRELRSKTLRFNPDGIQQRNSLNKISVIKRFYRKRLLHPFGGRVHQKFWMDYRYFLQAFQYYGEKQVRYYKLLTCIKNSERNVKLYDVELESAKILVDGISAA